MTIYTISATGTVIGGAESFDSTGVFGFGPNKPLNGLPYVLTISYDGSQLVFGDGLPYFSLIQPAASGPNQEPSAFSVFATVGPLVPFTLQGFPATGTLEVQDYGHYQGGGTDAIGGTVSSPLAAIVNPPTQQVAAQITYRSNLADFAPGAGIDQTISWQPPAADFQGEPPDFEYVTFSTVGPQGLAVFYGNLQTVGLNALTTLPDLSTPEVKQAISDAANQLDQISFGVGGATFILGVLAAIPPVNLLVGRIATLYGGIALALSFVSQALKQLNEDDPPDPNYSTIATPTPQTINLSGYPADLAALVTTGEQLAGVVNAMVTTIDRASGAYQAGNAYWEAQQLAALSSYYTEAAADVADLATELPALTQEEMTLPGSVTASVTLAQAQSFITTTATSGLPDPLLTDLNNLGASAATEQALAQVIAAADPNELVSFVTTGGLPSAANTTLTTLATDLQTVMACFGPGTRILTASGERPVEQLRVGDRIHVEIGDGVRPIVWIGHRSVNCRRMRDPRRVWPVRVAPHAFGEGKPCRELYLSPDHAVYIEGVLIPIRHLVNGMTIVQVERDAITWWHIELLDHNVLLAEGLPAESFLDTGNKAAFVGVGPAIQLRPDFVSKIWEARACAELVAAGPKLAAAREIVGMWSAEPWRSRAMTYQASARRA